jgi:hypothetical protein
MGRCLELGINRSRRGDAMTISGVSAFSANTYQPSSSGSAFEQTLSALVSSLNSGNLSGAQQAYSSLSLLQSSGQGPPANSPLSQALSQIGQALQSGNLTTAQQVSSSLQQPQGIHQGHHGRHGGGDSSSAPTNTDSSTSSTNILDVTA